MNIRSLFASTYSNIILMELSRYKMLLPKFVCTEEFCKKCGRLEKYCKCHSHKITYYNL